MLNIAAAKKVYIFLIVVGCYLLLMGYALGHTPDDILRYYLRDEVLPPPLRDDEELEPEELRDELEPPTVVRDDEVVTECKLDELLDDELR